MESSAPGYDSDGGDLKYSFLDRSSEALWVPPSDEFLLDPAVLDALNDIIAPATVAPTALYRSDWNSPVNIPCTHSLKYETCSSHSTTSSSSASPQASCDMTYVLSPSPEYEAAPMTVTAQTGEYPRQLHSETYSAYSLDPADHHEAQQNRITHEHLLSYLERIALTPRLRGRGARGGAAGYICRWPGCTWPQFSRRDHAKDHIAAHMNLKPHKCLKCPRAFLRAFDLRRHSKSCRRTWVETRPFDYDYGRLC